jgi:hypothetical protein
MEPLDGPPERLLEVLKRDVAKWQEVEQLVSSRSNTRLESCRSELTNAAVGLSNWMNVGSSLITGPRWQSQRKSFQGRDLPITSRALTPSVSTQSNFTSCAITAPGRTTRFNPMRPFGRRATHSHSIGHAIEVYPPNGCGVTTTDALDFPA